MLFVALLLSSTYALAPAALAFSQEPPVEETEKPSVSEEINPQEAAAQIREALKSKEEIVMVAALQSLGQIPSKLITAEVAKGLKVKSEAVVLAALEALRFNKDDSALGLLLKVRKDKNIQDNAKTAEAYAYALGQKGDKKAIPALTDDLIGTAKTPTNVITAKVLALGHIRHADSIQALLDYTKTTIGGLGRGGRGGGRKLSREAYGALVVLTGTDQGESVQAWEDWWYDHRNGFKVSPTEWPLENTRDQRMWNNVWLSPQEKEEAAQAAKEEKAGRRKKDDADL
jgi:hypothetical protein